jgi:hypothetical protein
LFLLVESFLEVALVAVFGEGDCLAVPLLPATRLVAGDEQNAVAPGIEREQNSYRAWS